MNDLKRVTWNERPFKLVQAHVILICFGTAKDMFVITESPLIPSLRMIICHQVNLSFLILSRTLKEVSGCINSVKRTHGFLSDISPWGLEGPVHETTAFIVLVRLKSNAHDFRGQESSVIL